MPISVTDLSNNSAASGATITITIPAGGVPAGALIFLATGENSTQASLGTATDSASNTYTSIQNSVTGGTGIQSGNNFYVKNCSALAQNNTITYTQGGTADVIIDALYATGIDAVAPLDTAVTAKATGSSTTPSVTSGTPGQSGELFIGTEVNTAGMTARYTQASGWSTPPTGTFGATSTVEIGGGNKINSGSAAQTFNPTLTVTAPWAVFVQAFKPAAAVPFVFIADAPTVIRIRLQQADLVSVRPPVVPAPTSARGDFEQPRPVKRMQFDPLLVTRPFPPPPPPFEWSVARGDFEQNKMVKRQQFDPLLIEPPQPRFVPPVMAWQALEQPVPNRIRPQQDNLFTRPFPLATGVTPMPWQMLEQPVPSKMRPLDNLVQQFVPRATGTTPMAWLLEQPVSVKVRPQQDVVAWSTFTPVVAVAAPLVPWSFEQPVQLRIRAQYDNAATFPTPPAAPPLMPSVIDEAYTTTVFIYDAIVQTPQPPAGPAPTMAWQALEQPTPVKMRVQDNLIQQFFPRVTGVTPMSWQVLEQPAPIKLRTQDNLVQQFVPQATGVTAMAWLFDQPIRVRVIPQADNLAEPPFPPAAIAPTMAWLLEPPTPVRIRPQGDVLIGVPFPGPTLPPTMAWLLDQPVLVRIRPQGDNLITLPFPPPTVAVPNMAWLFDQPVPIRIKPFGEVLIGPPQAFAAAQLLVPQPSEQPIPIRIRFAGEITAPPLPLGTGVTPMAWQALDQPIPLKTRFQGDVLTSPPQPIFVPPRMAWQGLEQTTPLRIRAQADNLSLFPLAVAVPPMSWSFEQPVVVKIKPFPVPIAGEPIFLPPPTPSALGFIASDQPLPLRIRPSGEVTSWPNAIPPPPTAIPPMSWLFDQPLPLRIRPMGDIVLIVPPAVFPPPIPPAPTARGGRPARDPVYERWLMEQSFILHWLLMDDEVD